MSDRTPTTQEHWERYADDLLGQIDGLTRELAEARKALVWYALVANVSDEDVCSEYRNARLAAVRALDAAAGEK